MNNPSSDQRILDLQATLVFQGAKLEVTHSLLMGVLKKQVQIPEAFERLQANVAQLVQERVDEYLAKISDEEPALVTRLKAILEDAHKYNEPPAET